MPRSGRRLPSFSGFRGILLIAVLVILAFVLFLPGRPQVWLGQMGSPLARIMEIPLHAVASVQNSVRDSWDHYVALQGVQEENQALQREIHRLESEQNLLREQMIISKQFQQLWGYQAMTPMFTVAARVIGRNASNWYRALIINKGSQDGIHKEMGVITEIGVVGRVVRTNPTTAIVLLLSDPNVAITGMVQNSRDEGIIQGTPQGKVQMKYLPPLSPVKPGDVVVTSGLTDDFPRGLRIGHIQQVTKAATDLFQSGEISPSVDFVKLEGVLIITAFQESIPQEMPTASPSPSS